MSDKLRKAELIKRQLQEADARKKKIFRWVTFGVQLWAIRMACAMFGMTIPFAINIYSIVYPIDNSIKYSSTLSSVSWFDIVKSEFKLITKIRTDGVPLIITEVPLVSSLAMRLFFERVLPTNLIQLKISPHKVFVHYSPDRLWSKMYNMSVSYRYVNLKEYNSDTFRSQTLVSPYSHLDQVRDDLVAENECDVAGSASCEFQSPTQFMYSTLTPFSAYVASLVPSLSHLYFTQSSDAQVSLWMSSPGVVASLHYDMEDNFLLQVAGNKSVILLAPEAFSCLRPHSSLHPHWRQSQLGGEAVTPRAVYEALRRVQTCYNTTNSGAAPVIWEVDLRAGDMVYIPAGFFHSVTAGRDSLSVNSWFSSSMSEAYSSLVNTALPFESSEPLPVKLASLSSLLRRVIETHRVLASYEAFVDSLGARYSDLLLLPPFQCDAAEISVESMCPRKELELTGTA